MFEVFSFKKTPKGVDAYDSEDEDNNIFCQSYPTKSNLNFSLKRSLVLFEEVFLKPGVWDQFVPVYAELLQRNGDEKTVRKFLEDYRDKNPLNPNTHRQWNGVFYQAPCS